MRNEMLTVFCWILKHCRLRDHEPILQSDYRRWGWFSQTVTNLTCYNTCSRVESWLGTWRRFYLLLICLRQRCWPFKTFIPSFLLPATATSSSCRNIFSDHRVVRPKKDLRQLSWNADPKYLQVQIENLLNLKLETHLQYWRSTCLILTWPVTTLAVVT